MYDITIGRQNTYIYFSNIVSEMLSAPAKTASLPAPKIRHDSILSSEAISENGNTNAVIYVFDAK
jgi:hypothetical protein